MMKAVDTSYDVEDAITSIVDKYEAKPTALIMVLQDIQKHYRYLPVQALKLVSRKMNLPIAQIYGVATFYRAFSLKPKGKHHICICTGTACHVRQSTVIIDTFERELKIKTGETTRDKEYSLETVNCLGACALGPLVTIDDVYYGNMTVSRASRTLNKIRRGSEDDTGDEDEEAE
jgi:NADH-quinone oxidoreductase subunit E